jgi:hypothetical protein
MLVKTEAFTVIISDGKLFNLDNLIIVFIPIVIVGLVGAFSKGKVAEFISKPTTIYIALILWTLLGFVLVLDNSMAWGCLSGTEETLNIVYSGLSILFLTIGFFLSDRKGAIILCAELIYWTFKLMAAKGGYAVGFGSTPDEIIVIFDSVALILRLLLIHSRINFVLTRKAYLLLPISFLLMTLKILFLR